MTHDKHAGMGGSYMINEAGEKVLVHRTDHLPEPPAQAPKHPKAAPVAKPVAPKQTQGDKA